jgi:hypothetical protein
MVSIFKSVTDVANPFQRSVDFCLNRIKQGDSKDKVLKYRKTKDPKDKKALPGVCFNGTFNTRSASGLIEPSGFLILDFDKFKTEAEAINYKGILAKEPFIYSAFISPSALGVKALVRIPKDAENFTLYFNALESILIQNTSISRAKILAVSALKVMILKFTSTPKLYNGMRLSWKNIAKSENRM